VSLYSYVASTGFFDSLVEYSGVCSLWHVI
jgi:hypothetical protein